MARIELSALETLDIKAVRTDDEHGTVMLVIHADDNAAVRIAVGTSADDADRLALALGKSALDAGEIGEEWDARPHRYDGYVSLGSNSRWYVTFSQQSPEDQPGNGYPSFEVAVYELAAMMAEAGEFTSAWAEGEHGPSSRNIDPEIRAFHDEGGSRLLPLDGVQYEPGDEVRYGDDDPSALMEVVRDYGTLGIWLAVAGDRNAGEAFITDRSLIIPVYEPGQLIEYVSHAVGPTAVKGWLPGIFEKNGASAGYVYVRQLARVGAGLVLSRVAEVRPVPAAVLSAARAWIADCEWADIEGADDIADLSDAQVARGIQKHYTGGWAAFRRDGA